MKTKAEFKAARRAARVMFRDAVAGADTSMRFAPATSFEVASSFQPAAFAKRAEREAAKSWAAVESLFI